MLLCARYSHSQIHVCFVFVSGLIMRRVVLHVGPSKTASTTLQQFLSLYRGEAKTFTYPEWGWTRPDNGHHNLAYELRNDARFNPSLGGLDALRKNLTQSDQVFLSSEDFPIHPRAIAPLVKLCEEFGYELEILFFLRDPIARLNSMYTQQIKTFADTRRFVDFVQTAVNEDKLNIRDAVIKPLSALGVKLTFAPFIGSRMGEIFARVCHHYGFEADPTNFSHTNPAPTPEEVALYRQIGHRMEKSTVSHWEACNRLTRKYGFDRKYFGFDAHLIEQTRKRLQSQYDDIKSIGLLFMADELAETFFTEKPKCADIEDQEKFLEFKHDIISYMHL
ncbi:hypothetical protein [Abyssibius alkaniclasticus]|uniref:hypothetical protein n=1 Tax=Abyssibius alkaniclasticus TaxID=2881234 RepID=UPI004058554F